MSRVAGKRVPNTNSSRIVCTMGWPPSVADGETDGHAVIGAGCVRVPTTPDQGVALTKQKPIAGIVDCGRVIGGGRRGLRRLMENGQESFAAAIVDLVQQLAIALASRL